MKLSEKLKMIAVACFTTEVRNEKFPSLYGTSPTCTMGCDEPVKLDLDCYQHKMTPGEPPVIFHSPRI